MSKKVDRERVFALLGFYDVLLTKTQKTIITSHYVYDLSLSEIAEEEGISRAAASEAIKTSIEKMEEYESKMKLVERYSSVKEKLESISKIEDKEERLKKYEELGEEIKHGI
ncbi:MAG: DNA-binding protein [Bacilli bacterium]|nr:DNA-binding protein [Bacilli bacterium]